METRIHGSHPTLDATYQQTTYSCPCPYIQSDVLSGPPHRPSSQTEPKFVRLDIGIIRGPDCSLKCTSTIVPRPHRIQASPNDNTAASK